MYEECVILMLKTKKIAKIDYVDDNGQWTHFLIILKKNFKFNKSFTNQKCSSSIVIIIGFSKICFQQNVTFMNIKAPFFSEFS